MATLMTQSGARTFFQDYLNALGVPNNFDFSSSGAVFVDELLKQVGDHMASTEKNKAKLTPLVFSLVFSLVFLWFLVSMNCLR